MNLVEKILARASGQESVKAGDVVVANVDRLVMHDLSAYLTGKVYDERIGKDLPYPDRVVTVFDHHFSPPTEQQADVLNRNRAWTKKRGTQLFDCGSGNIHNVLMQNGLALPGQIVVGSDSHTPVHGAVGAFAVALGNDSHAGTVMPFGKAWFRVPELIQIELTGELQPGTTPRDVALWLVGQLGEGSVIYKALEFTGPFITSLGIWDRWLFPVLCVDLGAKCGYVEPDDVTREFIEALPGGRLDLLLNGDGDPVEDVRRFDVGVVPPTVAAPPTVGNVHPVDELVGTPLQWAELGGHGGGRLEDFLLAARVLRGRRIHPDVKLNLVPGSREVFRQALELGLVADLHEAGGTWFPPSTGSNQTANMGAMSEGRR
ncbi:aconitase family protein [Naasia aerilata]|uniref:3-isopropylmalate dehydratase large subunit n=1 Tax=Naasia aerilata TaxID=1162966 RepID=A0ABN6XJL5_9MICO|nr:aconitase family protein [Naasia aerilata]BDZ45044.1 3-isopropylmalate dehydratase large subunit [Naasia aerilata]